LTLVFGAGMVVGFAAGLGFAAAMLWRD